MADEYDPIPERAKRDRDLKLIDWRTLAAVASHDRRSMPKGKGAGCYAGVRALAEAANTDDKSIREAIARLIRRGYLRDEPRAPGARRVLRVIYGEGDAPRTPEGTAPRTFDGFSNGERSPQGEGDAPREVRGAVPARTDTEADPKAYSVETARSHSNAHREDHENVVPFPGQENQPEPEPLRLLTGGPEPIDRKDLRLRVNDAILATGTASALSRLIGIDQATISKARNGRRISGGMACALSDAILSEFGGGSVPSAVDRAFAEYREAQRQGGLGSGDPVALFARLPERFFDLESSAQVPIIERTLTEIGFARVPAIHQDELAEITALLLSIADAFHGEQIGRHAQRVLERIELEGKPA